MFIFLKNKKNNQSSYISKNLRTVTKKEMNISYLYPWSCVTLATTLDRLNFLGEFQNSNLKLNFFQDQFFVIYGILMVRD